MRNPDIVYTLKMEYGLNFWLKASFIICIYATKIFFEIPPCANMLFFVTEFVGKNRPIYEVVNISTDQNVGNFDRLKLT